MGRFMDRQLQFLSCIPNAVDTNRLEICLLILVLLIISRVSYRQGTEHILLVRLDCSGLPWLDLTQDRILLLRSDSLDSLAQ